MVSDSYEINSQRIIAIDSKSECPFIDVITGLLFDFDPLMMDHMIF